MSIVHKSRVLLIRLGKALPFIVCAIVFISYTESALSLATSDFLEWNGYIIPNCRISTLIGGYFEYDFSTVVILTIISVSIESCIWNKIALAYLFFQLLLKQWLMTVELYPEQIAAITTINIIVCAWLCWKGIRISLK
jgi:hypothetical protein